MSQPPRGMNEPVSDGRPSESLPAAQEPEGLEAIYANFVRVSCTPEELVLDFGLNTHAAGSPAQPVQIRQRLVLNHYTAKRVLLTLGAALQRHEQLFGQLEIDVSRRVLPSAKPSAPR